MESDMRYEDVEMMDVEQGDDIQGDKQGDKQVNTNTNATASKKKNKKKRKKKRKKAGPTPTSQSQSQSQSRGVDIDRFVLSVCKRLREKKSYLVYTAVAVLGVSALSDLVNEVDAVQACGGQKTALGDRYRTSGGVLWNLLRTRHPIPYKEIMKRAKDFEKQFRQPISIVQQPAAVSSKSDASTSEDDSAIKIPLQEESAQPNIKEKRISVHDRIRVPVSYDDLPGEDAAEDIPSFVSM